MAAADIVYWTLFSLVALVVLGVALAVLFQSRADRQFDEFIDEYPREFIGQGWTL